MKVFTRLTLLALVAIVFLAAWKGGPMIDVGAGYLAKNLCSEVFVAGRPNVEQIRADLEAVDASFSLFRAEVDESEKTAAAWITPGMGRAEARYREGLGCSLIAGARDENLAALSPETLERLAGERRPVDDWPAVSRPLPALERALDDAFAEPFEGSQSNTRAVVVLHRGELVAERYAEPFMRDTPMIGWSMSKSITNNLVGILVRDGVLELDAPAPVGAWSDPSDVRHGITLRHLLQMSSGLEFSEVYEPGSDATRMLFMEPSAGLFAAEAGLAYPPGTHWYYSSGTTNILARIVFEATGGNVDAMYTFLHRRLLQPVGLHSMVIEPDASGTPVGSSFTYATARDWARLGQFWLQDGTWDGQRILPEGWMEWSASPAPAAPRGEYGAQFWLDAGRDGQHRSWPDLPGNLFIANGFNGQSVVVFPDQEIVVVRLGLTTDDSFSLGDLLHGVFAALTNRPEA